MNSAIPCSPNLPLYLKPLLHRRHVTTAPTSLSTSNPFGYALLCVGFPSSDLEVDTQDEDEVYWLQFGRYFARGPIERDDYALELALGDE